MRKINCSALGRLFFILLAVIIFSVKTAAQQGQQNPPEFLVGAFLASSQDPDHTLYNNYYQIQECGLNSVWQYAKKTGHSNLDSLALFEYVYAANDSFPNPIDPTITEDWISYFTHAKYFRWEAEGDENFPDYPGTSIFVGIKHNDVGHGTPDGWSCGEGPQNIGEYFIDGPHYTQYRRYVYTNRWLPENPLIQYNAVFRLKLGEPQEGSFDVAMLKVSVDTGSVGYGGVGEFPIDSLILTSDSLSTNYKEFTISYNYLNLMPECTGCTGQYPPLSGSDWIPLKGPSNTPWIDFTKKVRFKVQKRSSVEVIVDYVEVYDLDIWKEYFTSETGYDTLVAKISNYNQGFGALGSRLKYFFTMDEPHSWDSFIPVKKVQHILDSLNTGRDLLVHFFPGYNNKRELVQNVFEKWVNIAEPKKLMFWYAPFSCWWETTEYCDRNPLEVTFEYLRGNLQAAHIQQPDFFVTLQTWGSYNPGINDYLRYYKPSPAGISAEQCLH